MAYMVRPTVLGRRAWRKGYTLLAGLPHGSTSWHTSHTVAICPDERVYLSLGIAGNCVAQYLGQSYRFKYRRGGVFVLNEQGEQPYWEAYASDLRDPVGFDWRPNTQVMYLSNNGPGHLSYHLPLEYFSRTDIDSLHGMSWFQYDGKRVRPDYCIRGVATPAK
jgi:glucose/arabinose dehydrogenase